jgi:predicted porin
MKKILVAALTASVLIPASAMADSTTLYGNLRYSVGSVTDNNTDGLVASDNTSLLGVKGSYGDDIKAFFHLQTQANAEGQTGDKNGNAFQQRFFFGGLKGGFGTVKYGRLTNAYKMPGFKLDRFYNTAGINASGVYSAGGATYGLSGATNGFTDNSVEYTTPKLADSITLQAGIYIDDGDNDDHGTSFGVKYQKGAVMAGIVVAQNDTTTVAVPGIAADESATRLYGNYKGAGYTVGLSYETLTFATTSDINYLYVIGTYDVSAKTELIASFGSVDGGTAEGTGMTAGVYHKLLPNTKVFALYSGASLDDDINNAETDPSVVAVGVFHNFSISN